MHRLIRHPAMRAFVAVICAIHACAETSCAPPEPPAHPPFSTGGASCEQACEAMARLGCVEARRGPDVTRIDGTVRRGLECVEVCSRAVEDWLPMAEQLGCIASAQSREAAQACGVCR